ncbi:chemotaxis protein CheA [Paenibacillus xylaniclasticus]|uniref:chemotaxis protein CheA n=1 Tax=Paenibacillus xylaniclasticus TaxID=588083 RepID=UPI000FD869B0|nr:MULTISPECIES: chemotaxis protein CheA [Paenibacillus]GFN30455.1 chemotaxis protein CheA [Paenibacillus curdlanolyticus]
MGIHQGDPIFEAYITETSQLVEQLEEIVLACEHANLFSEEMIHEIFRIMHTIKGSSSMMNFHNIATLAHALEDLFSFLREHKFQLVDWSKLSDLMLEGVDFTKIELHKIKNGEIADGECMVILQNVKQLLQSFEQQRSGSLENEDIPHKPSTLSSYKATVVFTEDCEMENVRAYQIIHNLKDSIEEYWHTPEDVLGDPASAETIRNQGFQLFIKTAQSYDEIYSVLSQTSYLKHLELQMVENMEIQIDHNEQTQDVQVHEPKVTDPQAGIAEAQALKEVKNSANSYQGKSINVNVGKLDELMDLVGELVIAEAMVTQNPDIIGLQLEQFHKAAAHLQKITKEIQDKVMEIRMVPLSTTFQRMHRVVRDMSKKLGKNVRLQLIGEETEVDKNIIEHISDPLMHLVRNAVDHGLESVEERTESGKSETGTLSLEALNVGGEVLIVVRDDGRGLNKRKILDKAKFNQLLHKSEADMTDKEIYNLIFLPGFSTKEQITEFSGRGVGMDVVMQNIAAVGGTISVDSHPGRGSVFTIKIPLTLAIIDGMNVRVGEAEYTLPTTSIVESFKPLARDVITDPHGNEMMMVRGDCYPILRLHKLYSVFTEVTQITDGIVIMVEQDGKRICIFVDELVGQQQVVVKALPSYIRGFNKVEGISGCTLLGNGNISLILDVQGLLKMR